MSRRYYDLPPLAALLTFEAAARLLSFKDAARELSVTPGAVSHQIKALEAELSRPLFIRKHRGVELTHEGEALRNVLTTSFLQVSKTLETIRNDSSDDQVTVGATTAVAALWLSPAVIRFWQDYPQVKVNQLAQDTPFTNREEVDLFIQYGQDGPATQTHTKLFRDTLSPVCSPEMAAHLKDARLEDLTRHRLIHLEARDSPWTTWHDWFQTLGFAGDIPIQSKVNSYSLALQMARKGAGLALGWRRLTRPMLNSGKLVALDRFSIPAPRDFYLVGPAEDQLTEGARLLKTWLLDEVRSH